VWVCLCVCVFLCDFDRQVTSVWVLFVSRVRNNPVNIGPFPQKSHTNTKLSIVCAEFLRGPFFSKFSSTTEPCGYRSLYAKEPYEYEINVALLWKEPYVYETNMAFLWKDPNWEGDFFFFRILCPQTSPMNVGLFLQKINKYKCMCIYVYIHTYKHIYTYI